MKFGIKNEYQKPENSTYTYYYFELKYDFWVMVVVLWDGK